MRWSYLMSRGVVLGLAWIVLVFVVDPLLRAGIIWGGESVFQAKVEIAELQTGVFPPRISLASVAVANADRPQRNLFEFEEAEIRLDTWGLARKKLIVDEGSIHGLEWDTARETSGELADVEDWEWESINGLKKSALEKSRKWLQEALNKTKGQLDPDQLESVRLAKQLQAKWKTRFETLEQRINEIEQQYQQIERHVKFEEKNPLEKVRAYAGAADGADRLLKEVRSIQQELRLLPAEAQADFQKVELARQRDQKKLHQKLDFIKLDPATISEAMLGEQLADQLQETLEWGRWIQQNFPDTEPPEPERYRGEDVLFTLFEPVPDVLVRRLDLSGSLMYQNEPEPFQGELRGWTTQPGIYGKPVEIELQSQGKLNLVLHSTIDQRGAVPVSLVQLRFNAPVTKQEVLGNPEQLALEFSARSAVLEASLRMEGENVSGDILLIQEPVTLRALSGAANNTAIQNILAGALRDVNRFESRVNFAGDVHNLRWDVQSNLGTEISNGMTQALAQTWQAGQAELQAQANKLVQAEMKKLSQSMTSRYGQLSETLKLSQRTIQNLIPRTAGGGPLKGLDLNNLRGVLR